MTKTSAARVELVWSGVVSLMATVALVLPMFWPLNEDSFPLSSYPMFATSRGQPVMHRLVVRHDDGTTRRVDGALLGSGEVLQAMAWLDSAGRRPKQRAKLCRGVAAALGARAPMAGATVELQRVRFDPIHYFVEGPTPLEQRVLERCDVPGQASAAGSGATP